MTRFRVRFCSERIFKNINLAISRPSEDVSNARISLAGMAGLVVGGESGVCAVSWVIAPFFCC